MRVQEGIIFENYFEKINFKKKKQQNLQEYDPIYVNKTAQLFSYFSFNTEKVLLYLRNNSILLRLHLGVTMNTKQREYTGLNS